MTAVAVKIRALELGDLDAIEPLYLRLPDAARSVS